MRKIIFVLFSAFFVYGCFPAIHIVNKLEFISESNLLQANNNKSIDFTFGEGEKFYLFGFIPTLFRGNYIKVYGENLNTKFDLKINSYIIKINGKTKIEKKKNIKIDNIYETKNGNICYCIKRFNSYKKDDLIEIILDVSVFNNGNWERNVISQKYIGIRKNRELTFLWD